MKPLHIPGQQAAGGDNTSFGKPPSTYPLLWRIVSECDQSRMEQSYAADSNGKIWLFRVVMVELRGFPKYHKRDGRPKFGTLASWVVFADPSVPRL